MADSSDAITSVSDGNDFLLFDDDELDEIISTFEPEKVPEEDTKSEMPSPKFCVSQRGLKRHMTNQHQPKQTHAFSVIASTSTSTSSSSSSNNVVEPIFKPADLYRIIQNSLKKLSADECYPESV